MSNNNIKFRAYRSCYIVDVQINDCGIKIQDSSKNNYFINTDDKDAIASFKQWFSKVFIKGISQTLTVFQYRVARSDEDGPEDIFIEKFILHPSIESCDEQQSLQ